MNEPLSVLAAAALGSADLVLLLPLTFWIGTNASRGQVAAFLALCIAKLALALAVYGAMLQFAGLHPLWGALGLALPMVGFTSWAFLKQQRAF